MTDSVKPEVEMTSKLRKTWRRCPFSPKRGPKKQLFSIGCDLKCYLALLLTQLHLNMMVHDKPEVEMAPKMAPNGAVAFFLQRRP